jgi:hypothetical protein
MKVGFLALALLSACTAHKKPSKVETALANMAKDIVIPIETDHLKNRERYVKPILRAGGGV